ncbi:MAG: hypothetical protein H7Y17_17425 [Chlorobia bacterium]|nr:hypothetical protein [Fimbriimonadaceae bacterium]
MPPARLEELGRRYAHSQYLMRKQMLKLLGSSFRIYDLAGNLAFFVHQKAFKLKEDIRVYADEAKTTEMLVIKARQIMDFNAAYDVVDSLTGQKIGALKRKGWSSMIRDEWIVMDATDREIGKIIEDSTMMALLRRFLSNLIPQNFDVLYGNLKVLDLRQHFNPFLFKMDIDFSVDPSAAMDRRLGISCAVLICALEGRQSG